VDLLIRAKTNTRLLPTHSQPHLQTHQTHPQAQPTPPPDPPANQRVTLPLWRLLLKHVQRHSRHLAGFQRARQCVVIDDAAARDVDDAGALVGWGFGVGLWVTVVCGGVLGSRQQRE